MFFANGVVTVPILLRCLGQTHFAAFALVAPFLRYGFNGIFDFGIATAVVRHVSRSYAEKDWPQVRAVITGAQVIYLCAGGALFFIAFIALKTGGSRMLASANVSFGSALLFLAAYVIFLFTNPFFSLLMASGNVAATHLLGAVALLVELVGIVVLSHTALSLYMLGSLYIGNALLCGVIAIALATRQLGHLPLQWHHAAAQVPKLLNFSTRYAVTLTSTLCAPLVDKLILAEFAGAAFVAAYEAAFRIAEILKRVTQLMLLPLFPMAGAREKHHIEEKNRLYRVAFSANLALSVGLYLIPVCMANIIFRGWLGMQTGTQAAIAFRALGGTAFVLALLAPAWSILTGTGRMPVMVCHGVATLILNLLIGAALGRAFGFRGELAGMALAQISVSLAVLVWLSRDSEFKVGSTTPIWMSFYILAAVAISTALLGFPTTHPMWQVAALIVFAFGAYSVILLSNPEIRGLVSRVLR